MHYLDTLHLKITMNPAPADLHAIVQGFTLVPAPPHDQLVPLQSAGYQAYDVKLIGSHQPSQPGNTITLQVYRHPPPGSENQFPNKQVPATWPSDFLNNNKDWPMYIPGSCQVLVLQTALNYQSSPSLLSDEERRLMIFPKDSVVQENAVDTNLGKVINLVWLYKQKNPEAKIAGQIVRFENPNGRDMYFLTKLNESPIPVVSYLESGKSSPGNLKETADILNTYGFQLHDSAVNASLPNEAGLVIVYKK